MTPKAKRRSKAAAARQQPERPKRIVPLHGAREHAPATARLTYRGGPLLTGVEVVTAFWGSAWTSAPNAATAQRLNEFFTFIVSSDYVKQLAEYNTPLKADGIIAINLRDGDELIGVRHSSGDDDILMVSRSGQAIRFHEKGARPMARATSGLQRARRRPATQSRSSASPASRLGRPTRLRPSALRCASNGRYLPASSAPRLSSRLTVEGDRWIEAAIDRIDCPATRARDISSRSAKVSAHRERRRDAGRIPPVSARIRCTDEWFRSNNWAICWRDSPFRQRSHISAFWISV